MTSELFAEMGFRRAFCGGWQDDPEDAIGNDAFLLDKFGAASLSQIDWRHKLNDIPIADQTPTQSCVGHSMSIAIALCMRAKGTWAPQPSALHIYDMARGHDRIDAGTTLFSAVDSVARFGWLSEAELPWNPELVSAPNDGDRTPWGLAHKAWRRAGMKHHRVLVNVRTSIENALSQGLGVVIGCDVGPEFEDLGPLEIYAGEPVRLGGHAMALVGFDSDCVTVRNSWGEYWCHQGHGRIAWDFIESQKTRSIWVVDSMPQLRV